MATSDQEVVLTHTRKLGNAEFDIFCKSQPAISHHIFSIQKYLAKSHPFYYNSLLSYNKGRPLETIQKNLRVEYDKLLAERDTFQVLSKALASRDKCIQKIKNQLPKIQRLLTMFKKSYLRSNNITHSVYMEYVEKAGYSNVEIEDSIESSIKTISEVFIDMSRLRDMTLYVVENIHKWKVELEEWMDKCDQYSPVSFIHNGQNAYYTITEDIKFIWESALSQHIYIDTENDPFMVRNVMQVEERPHKTILQKYFVQLLYPKSQQIVTRSLKCYQMLTFKYEPQARNLYHEEQLLIENYLSLKQQQQDQETIQEISQNQFEWQDKLKKQKHNRLTANGWVFGKVLKKPNNEKVKDMVQRHQQKIAFIRPFNITNYTQKDSLALAFQAKGGLFPLTKGQLAATVPKSRGQQLMRSEVHTNNGQTMRSSSIFESKKQKDIEKLYRSRSTKTTRQVSLKKALPIIQDNINKDKGHKSQHQQANDSRLDKMYRSLSKLSPVILQDPREQNEETPKHNKARSLTKGLINDKLLRQSHSSARAMGGGNPVKLRRTLDSESTQKTTNNTKLNTFDTTHQDSIKHQDSTNHQDINHQDVNHQDVNHQDINHQDVNQSIEEISELIHKNPSTHKQSHQNIANKSELLQVKEVKQEQVQDQNHQNPDELMKKVEKQKITNNYRKNKLQTNQSKLATLRQLIDVHTKATKIPPSVNQKTTPSLNHSSNNNHSAQSFYPKDTHSLTKKQPSSKPKLNSPYTTKYNLTKSDKTNQKQDKSKIHVSSNELEKPQSKSKILASQKEFDQYKQVEPKSHQSDKHNQPFKFIDDFIILTSKSIPVDIIPQYLKYLFNQLHSTSKKFSLYSYDTLIKKLQDPYSQCIVFQVSTQKRGPIGQVILSETIGISSRKLRYTIEFINIHMFELVVGAVLRIAEQLLYATPCEQVICPLMQDRLDPVSTHFVQLIENAFKAKVHLFGQLSILQKKQLQAEQIQLHQRLYIFSSTKKQRQINFNRIMMGNYRSLRLQCKCLMLSSNFRMRSKNISKSVVANYQSESLGFLYRKVLEQIITKYHLKQMKVASVNSGQMSEAALLLKQSSFLRTSMTALAQYLRQQTITEDDYIYMTRFTSMGEILRYMEYKEYSKFFQFEFLEESRFILHHELFLTEIELDLSLQFMVRQSVDFLILFNHHNFMIKVIEPNLVSQAKAVILPTTHDQIQLILIDGKQYHQETTSKLDLFSYLYIYQQNNLKNYKEQHNMKEIVIPMIQSTNRSLNEVKMFDGLFRLFPQRQFYSGTYFNCTNLWESYFPSAVVYQPQPNSIIFEYPLIVGFMHKKKQQILTAFLLKSPPVE